MSFLDELNKDMTLVDRVKVKALRVLSWMFVPKMTWRMAMARPYIHGLGFIGAISTPDEHVSFEGE
jgi:hypothetical protein